MKEARISKSQVEEIKAARKANQNKKIEKRLHVLEMYGAGTRRTGLAYDRRGNEDCP